MKNKRIQFASSYITPSHQRIVCEQGINIEDSEEESNDNRDNGFEATIIPTSNGAFEPHNSCFGGQK